jgi:hypothetical protein
MIRSFPSELFTPILTNEKPFDINTFVLKRKKGQKTTTPPNEDRHSDVIRKQSPSVSLDAHVSCRSIPTSIDATRIM